MSQIGGQSKQQALDSLVAMTAGVQPIALAEYQARIKKAQQLMQQHGIDALYLNAGTNLSYFTGTVWYASERLVGALLPAQGELVYLSPVFEIPTLAGFQVVQGEVLGWHEHENPYQLLLKVLQQCCAKPKPVLALDDSSAFFIFEGLHQALNHAPAILHALQRLPEHKPHLVVLPQKQRPEPIFPQTRFHVDVLTDPQTHNCG